MDNLQNILLKLQELLGELDAILVEEVNQLQRIQINPVSLQIVSDSKSQLLATISHYDELRKQQESILQQSAPYQNNTKIALCWKDITRRVKSANELNKKVHDLLELHMQKTNDLKNLFTKASSSTNLYSQDGQSNNAKSGKVYNISV